MTEIQPEKTYTFLLVEDQKTIRMFLNYFLTNAYKGCKVIEAEEGKQALAALRETSVDLIITDMEMPGRDGETLLKQLKGNAVLAKKPTLIYTGSPSKGADFEKEYYATTRLVAKGDQVKLKESLEALLNP